VHMSREMLGVLAAFAVLLLLSGYIYMQSRKAPVHSGNVNAEWDEDGTSTPDVTASTPRKEALSS